MRIFGRFLFSNVKGESSGQLFDKARKMYEEIGSHKKQIFFYFEEAHWHKTSALDRAISRYPELKDFEYQFEHYNSPGYTGRAISNLDTNWLIPNTKGNYGKVDINILNEIDYGIPRSFPFLYSFFIFDKIDWFGNDVINKPASESKLGKSHPAFPNTYLSPSIIVWNDSCNGKKYYSIWAIIELTQLYDGIKDKPKIDNAILEKLKILGNIRKKEFIAVE
ncbi:MAG TPA: hypothetical protein VEF53_07465 [Patescibacteria group bacterium]|nr:hypothetical protein [Patescibacteria group bacterium]